MQLSRNFLQLVFIVIVVLNCSSSFGSGSCDGQTTFDGPDCGTLAGGSGCTPPQTCESDDSDPGIYCCLNLSAVPEIPSWVGPFFPAFLLAGFSYLKNRYRSTPRLGARHQA
jgi:hypothetical protein